ncbi:MAG: hypothetical protein QGM50_01300 [Anaerolineae bacterium]|nr:hypothetical protein [Anaerolineae bacterium]
MGSTALEAILDVVIGMIFMWLILSIATMSIQEWIASYLKWRSKDLQTVVQRLLGNSKLWSEHLYAHPLIQGLSKKTGVKPSYIPANKFALALSDIVMSAGTEQAYIQRQMLAAKGEIENAPDQIYPYISYLLKRFARFVRKIINKIAYFLGSNRGMPDQKFEIVLGFAQNLFHASTPSALGDLQEKFKKFFSALLDDEITLSNGKSLSVSSADFLNTYPRFRNFILKLLEIILQSQPNIKYRWAEILVHNDNNLLSLVQKNLEDSQSYREKVREVVQERAENLDLHEEDLEELIHCIKQTFDEINYIPVVNYIQESIGTSQGMEALQVLNSPLHIALSQMRDDIIGIVNTPEILEHVRERFAIAATNLEQDEFKLSTMRLNIETWFKESMDRLSGWYKRKATVLAFFIGLILATLLNVDSIALASHLWREPAVRQALAANAAEFTSENTLLPTIPIEDNEIVGAVEYFNEQFKDLNLPLGWIYEPVPWGTNQSCRLVPIGENVIWGIKDNFATDICHRISNAPNDSAEAFLKFMGIIITAFAAAQGAPFWFEILKKVVNIRGSGAKPDEKTK